MVSPLLFVLYCGFLFFSSTPSGQTVGDEMMAYCPRDDGDECRANSDGDDPHGIIIPARMKWSEENVQDVVKLWEFDSNAEAKLWELGKSVSDINHWKNDPYEVVRFLEDLQMDVPKSEVAFRKMIQWRLDEDMDTFLQRYSKNLPKEIFYNPTFILKGLDRDGDPIFVERTGRLDGWGLYKRLGPKGLLDLSLFFSELISTRGGHNDGLVIPKECDWQQTYYEPLSGGRRLRQFTSLVDLEGLQARQMRPALFALFKQATRIDQDYYPGLVKRIIVIRAPKLFRMVWKVVKHFYDPRTLDKFIFVTDDNYLDVVDQYIEREHLPTVIDPTHGQGQPMPGFFEKVNMEGGRIPTN